MSSLSILSLFLSSPSRCCRGLFAHVPGGSTSRESRKADYDFNISIVIRARLLCLPSTGYGRFYARSL
jgi:hypothetical protein